ncbi:hypothetical protein BH10ACT11_BH10ACT11_13740 [soil metagenome]
MTRKAQFGLILVAVLVAVLAAKPWPGSGDSESADGAVESTSPTQPTAPDSASNSSDYYPPAPSTAVGMTPEWRAFADQVDRTCAVSFNYAVSIESAVRKAAREQGWGDPRAEAAIVGAWSDEDLRISAATGQMGRPPQRQDLFQRWRANVSHRAVLFHDAAVAASKGEFAKEDSIFDRIYEEKDQADVLGQRFGLRICTSN